MAEPQTMEIPVVDPGASLTAKKDFLGYALDPALQHFSTQLVKQYDEVNLPLAQSVAKAANPQATPEDRVKAAEAMKKMTGVDQPQYMNVFQAVLNGNIRDIGIAMNGGADIPSQAFDIQGNPWIKVFNERKTPQNPLGEIRHYVDSNGKKYTPQEAEKATGGPIVSKEEIPIANQNFYIAQGVNAKTAAQAQAVNWVQIQARSKAALENGSFIRDTSKQLDENFYNDPSIIKASVDPKIRGLIAGINQIRTGNTKEFQSSVDKLKEAASGNLSFKDNQDLKNQTGGFNLGFNLNERKELVNSDGTKATTNDIERAVRAAKDSMSSNNAVESRQQNLLERAQIAAANYDPVLVNKIRQAINLEAQKSMAINAIEAQGGIGVARPSLAHEVGDDFALAGVKNKMSQNYGNLADYYGQKVSEFQQLYPSRTPGINDIANLMNDDPYIKESKKSAQQGMIDYSRKMESILREIKPQLPAEIIGQPGAETTGPVVPRAPTSLEVGQPAGSKPPVVKPAAKEKAEAKQETLAEIRARLKANK